MMRIVLFLATNMAIMLVFGVVANLLGIPAMLRNSSGGMNMDSLLLFSALIGFGGSIISLLLSKTMAKRSMQVQLIDQPQSEVEHWLVRTVARQAEQAGIDMPEVGIFPSQAMNAFATGWNKNKALVAVSAGLLNQMNQDEVEAVLGHEISHVANGDMVTLGLIQGVVNTFVIFIARIVANTVAAGRDGRSNFMVYMAVSFVAEIVLGFLASMIVAAFSRWREFRADAGGADLAGKQKMIAALQRLQGDQREPEMKGEFAAFGIRTGGGVMAMLSSHPPLDKRIERLQQSMN